jgi:hypothetical protein
MAMLRRVCVLLLSAGPAWAFVPLSARGGMARRAPTSPTTLMAVEDEIDLSQSTTEKQKATSFGPATVLRKMRLDIPWLAEGAAPAGNKVNIPPHVREILAQVISGV